MVGQRHEIDEQVAERVAAMSPQAREQFLAQARVRDTGTQAESVQRSSVRPPLRRRGEPAAPLSFQQEQLWFIEQIEHGAPHHSDGIVLLLDGALDVGALRSSLDSIVSRHEILRTAFRREGERVVQIVTPARALALPLVDLAGAALEQDDPVLSAAVLQEMAEPLDLTTGQTLRTTLFRIAADQHALTVVIDHLVCDLWSFDIVARELAAHYTAYLDGRRDARPPKLPVQYADYAVWQRSWLTDERLTEHLRERARALAGAPPMITLPTRGGRPTTQGFVGAVHRFQVDAELTKILRGWSNDNGATLYMGLLATFTTLLSTYTGQRDIVVAVPAATRDPVELERLIGCFLNMIVIRTQLDGQPSFTEVVQRVRTECLDAYHHRDLPFGRLVAHLQPTRTRSHQPIAQVAFVLQNMPQDPLELPGLRVRSHKLDTGRARMDISVWMTETDAGLVGEVEYDLNLFTEAQIASLAERFVRLLRAAMAEPQRCVWDLQVIDDAELHRMLHEWNDTAVDFGVERVIHRLVEAQASRTPDATALAAVSERLTYRKLNERANRLARYMRRFRVGPEISVAVCLPRCAVEVVAILAVLKAGGCYVPISPSDPVERREFILSQSAPALVLSAGDLADDLWSPGRRVLDLDQEWEAIEREEARDLDVTVSSDNLAYNLFTSGSTGRPKGVLVTHRGFANRMLWAQRNYPLDGSDRVLRKAACTFDVSLDELFRALLNGATSVLMPELDAFDPRRLAAVIEEFAVTDADFAPTAIRELLSTVDAQRLRSLRRIVSGVEELSAETQRLILDRLDVTLFNLYGPTEVSVSCTSWRCERDSPRRTVPIGRPMANVRVYVLDARMGPVPAGVTGELYVGGDGLARGYLGSPEFTAQRFVPDPFSGESGARLYRTGDLARYGDDGTLEFMGRADGQINLRGYRIEPGEVEACLREHPAITEAAVTRHNNAAGDDRLVGYLVCACLPEPAELRAFLRTRVPDYMVPSAFVRLDALPLTSHGKVDTDALAPPGNAAKRAGRGGGEPRNDVERILVEIWSQVLSREDIGTHDDFFDLGGESLAATRILARASTELGVEVEVSAIFDAPTIAELASRFAR